MISLQKLSKSYANGKVRAVDDLTLHVRKGEIFGFIGPNGAGKTTTIKMITGLLTPTEGAVLIDGVNMAKNPIAAKMKIGFVPDNHEIHDRLTGTEYLNFMGDVYGVPTEVRRRRIQKYLSMFGIEQVAGELIRTYSHGMKQKLVLTGALLHTPPLWILDEPMVGLDPKSSALLKEEMRSHTRAGHTVFFSTHVLEVAEKLCDRIGIILGGKLVCVGTFEELRAGSADSSLEEIFLKLTEEGGARNE